jgi:hypothetical protein
VNEIEKLNDNYFRSFLTSRVASSFPPRSKPINAKSITPMPHSRAISQSPGKASAAMDCTSTGRHTDIRFVHENASDSIRRNNESDSIEIDESDSQLEKQPELRISTVRGMAMDVREEKENA